MATEHTFAIGDIHGRADLLGTLLHAIDERARDQQIEYSVVFLGDVIDRGPASRDAMKLVAETLAKSSSSRLILGNHDWFPIRILDELVGDHQHMALEHWIWRLGGDATLASYGFDPEAFSVDDLRRYFPSDHLDMLRAATSFVDLPHHILVHAGIAPGIPIAEQTRQDLMWIREPFLSYEGNFGKNVVHGHTPTTSQMCEVKSNRIAIDTGAYATDRLSAIHITPTGNTSFIGTVPNAPGKSEIIVPVSVI